MTSNSKQKDSIGKLYEQVELWHGTGRYHYVERKEIGDILKGIVEAGALEPQDDDWDRKRGKIQSISLARSRMYARLYACMHSPFGKRLENELGSRYLWGYYFFGTAEIVAQFEYPFARPIPDYKHKIVKWTHEVSRKKNSLVSIFIKGTDIPSNYPVLIGIKRGTVRPADDSLFFSLHEERSEAPIPVQHFTHIEVPQDKVEETELLLRAAGFDTPVISIEQGEDYCRKFSFRKLVSGLPLI